MKSCPHCGAPIGESTRFCTACMTSLNQKRVISTHLPTRRRWLPFAAAVLAFVLIGVLCLSLPWGIVPLLLETTAPTTTTQSMIATGGGNPTDGSGSTHPVDSTAPPTITQTENPTGSKSETDNPVSTTTAPTTTTKTGVPTSGKDTTDTTNSTKPQETTTASQPDQSSIYLYREAKRGDDFSANATLEDAVVITGVTTPVTSGVYVIPETLDGKRVVAIMGLAFCADNIQDTVKTVIVPPTVRTIWNYAFATCYQLTDIYFLGEAVYTEGNAFADPEKRVDTLTIHCSATCTDRALRYYKNAATNYQAQYENLSESERESIFNGAIGEGELNGGGDK